MTPFRTYDDLMGAHARDGGWLLTVSGVAFDLRDPRPQDIRPLDVAHALAHLCRFGGHARTFYSVAQHCVLVSRLVLKAFALAGSSTTRPKRTWATSRARCAR